MTTFDRRCVVVATAIALLFATLTLPRSASQAAPEARPLLGDSPASCDEARDIANDRAALSAAIEHRLARMQAAAERSFGTSDTAGTAGKQATLGKADTLGKQATLGKTGAPAEFAALRSTIESATEVARTSSATAESAERAAEATESLAACSAAAKEATAAGQSASETYAEALEAFRSLGGSGLAGMNMMSYCVDADNNNLRTGDQVLSGNPSPGEIATPGQVVFVGDTAAEGVFEGSAEVWTEAGDSLIRVRSHIADDTAAASDLWDLFGRVEFQHTAGLFTETRYYEPLCYQNALGAPGAAPAMGYIDTREQIPSGNPPPDIAAAEPVRFTSASWPFVASPSAPIMASAVRLAAPDNPIESDRHVMYIGEEPYDVGEQAPADLGVRLSDSLLTDAEGWLDGFVEDFLDDLDADITSLARVDNVTISNAVTTVETTPIDANESMLRVAISVNEIRAVLQKQNGKNCGTMEIGPVSVNVGFTFDRSSDGKSLIPRLATGANLELGNISANQTAGFWGCAVTMTSALGDVSDRLEDRFGGSGTTSDCGFGGWFMAGAFIVAGAVLMFLPGGQIAGGAAIAGGVALAAQCVNLVFPGNFWNGLDLVLDIITGDVDFDIALDPIDLTQLIDQEIITPVSSVNLDTLVAGVDALSSSSFTLVDSCTPYGCQGGDIAITPTGIEVLADANLQITSGTGTGASLDAVFNHPPALPDWVSPYNDGRSVADVVAMNQSISGQPIDLALVLGYDTLNQAMASLVAGGVLDSAHGDTDCNGDVVDQSTTVDFGGVPLPVTFDVSSTMPPFVAGLPYTDPDNGQVLPATFVLTNLVVDIRTTQGDLLLSVYVDGIGGLGFDFNTFSGVLTPRIDLDPNRTVAFYRDSELAAGVFSAASQTDIALQIGDALSDALDNLVGGACGFQPIDVGGGLSDLTSGTLNGSYQVWAEGFAEGIAVYANVLSPLSASLQVLSSNADTGAIQVRANPSFGSSSATDFRWRFSMSNTIGGSPGFTVQSGWTAWQTGDNQRSFTFSLPAPLPDMNQEPIGRVEVEVRDQFGRVGAASTTRWFYVECSGGGGGGGGNGPFDCFI
jgi:hypothetical protein